MGPGGAVGQDTDPALNSQYPSHHTSLGWPSHVPPQGYGLLLAVLPPGVLQAGLPLLQGCS